MKHQYHLYDLKVDIDKIVNKYEPPNNGWKQEETEKGSTQEMDGTTHQTDDELTNGQAVMVFVLLIAIYAGVTALPTYFMMRFLGWSFWLSHLVSFIGVVFMVWIFGLYKPASNKQKLRSKLF